MKKLLLSTITVLALAGSAVAADLPARSYTKAPMMDPAYNWTGFYLGLNAGGAWGRSNAATSTVLGGGYFANSSVPAIAAIGDQRLNGSGFTGGLTAGYNWQASNVVVGLESDFNYLGLKRSTSAAGIYPCCAPDTFTVRSTVASDWLITFRPRVGIANNNWLFYVTGGLAVANVKGDFSFTDTFAAATESASLSKIKTGWTVGAGIEYALMNGWSVKGEYLHVDLGNISATSTNLVTNGGTFPASVFTHSAALKTDIVRAGLNYKFGGPVVARY